MLSFYFQPIEFVKNLKYMGIGMLGVFINIGVIMVRRTSQVISPASSQGLTMTIEFQT